MPDDRIIISAISGVTPIGGNINQSCYAIQAGVNLFEEHVFLECEPHDTEWDPSTPLVAATYHLNNPETDGFNRMLTMAIEALKEIINNLKFSRKDLNRCGLFLAMPEQDEITHSWRLNEKFIGTLCGKTGLESFAEKTMLFNGRTGALDQLQNAMKKVQQGKLDCCIIVGVDSFLAEDRVTYFDQRWRIKSDRTVDGFIPGEACVMFAIEKSVSAQTRKIQPLASIEAIAFGQEEHAISGKKQSTAVASSQVLQNVIAQASCSRKIEWTLSDMNGESYTGREWGTVLVRNGDYFTDQHQLDHPVDCVGELGAAIGALLVSMATHAFSQNYQKANEVYITTSADNGNRAGLLLKKYSF